MSLQKLNIVLFLYKTHKIHWRLKTVDKSYTKVYIYVVYMDKEDLKTNDNSTVFA